MLARRPILSAAAAGRTLIHLMEVTTMSSTTTRKINWPALFISIVGIIVLIVISVLGVRYAGTNDAAVAALDTRVTTTEQGHNVQQGQIDSLRADHDGLATLEANNNTAQQGQIDSLAGRIGTAEGEIDSVQSTVASQTGQITNLQTGLTDTQNDVGALQGDITAVISQTSDLEQRIAALEASAATTSTLQISNPVTTTTVSGLTVTVGSAPALTGTGTLSGTTAISGTTATTGTLTSGASSALSGAVTITDTIGTIFSATGIQQSVDPATVDTAKGGFTNSLGLGSEGFIAEPGVMMIDYPVCSAPQVDVDNFTDTVLSFWAKKVKEANGAIGCTDTSNQALFTTRESFINLPEGGWVVATVNGTSFEIGDATFTIDGRPAHNAILIVRGQYGDQQMDTDRNQTIRFFDYTPGHGMATRYPLGGFVSENHFLQLAASSASSNTTNCGDGGCSTLTAVMYDVNTGALTVLYRPSPTAPFEEVYRNW